MEHKLNITYGVREVPDPWQTKPFVEREHDGTAHASCTCGLYNEAGDKDVVSRNAREHWDTHHKGN